jgi:hypothetical protein
MGCQTISIAAKRVVAITLKYCEGSKDDPDLDLGQRINCCFFASATEMQFRCAGIDNYVEDGEGKKLYHLIDSNYKTQEQKNNTCRRMLRKQMKNDVVSSQDEDPPKPIERKLAR